MKNIENELTRREILGNSLKTAGGIILAGGASNLFGSCAIEEDKHYRFDLSRLNSWQADLFLKAGRYWGINEGRDDSSRNKVYFGKILKRLDGDTIAYASWKSRTSKQDFSFENSEKVWTFTITFKHDENWVNCDLEGEFGQDFYNAARHEWGHIATESSLHSKDPKNIMYEIIRNRCYF